MSRSYPREPGNRASQVAEATTHYAEWLPCPSCGHQIALSTENLTWTVRRPTDVAHRLMARYSQLERESLVVITMNAKNRVLDEREVYRGNVSASLVRIAELFTEAVRRHANAILIVHRGSGRSMGRSLPN